MDPMPFVLFVVNNRANNNNHNNNNNNGQVDFTSKYDREDEMGMDGWMTEEKRQNRALKEREKKALSSAPIS